MFNLKFSKLIVFISAVEEVQNGFGIIKVTVDFLHLIYDVRRNDHVSLVKRTNFKCQTEKTQLYLNLLY